MSEKQPATIEASPEQLLYARILEIGMYIGLLVLFVTFGLYAFGIVDPYIPLDEISNYWSMNVNDYLEHTEIKAGWAWLGMLKYGDFINFIGVAILAGVTIICYAAIVPTLLKNNDKVYAILAVLEVIILSAAASGILAVGH
ncbi:MAG: DUF1634 domain-containing protein [Deltaproteobacteria bacterium]|nr:DUF1634 domain-containing protein [Deltaproteobacteria bacterium]MBW2711330.1 DUF1634 domain-containing protein [Deltaproteobacteria bacterium]